MTESIKKPLVTVDVAIFTVHQDELKVLLVKRPEAPFAGSWALPGGIVDIERDASLEACALRKLREKTGVASPYLEQLGSWGNAKRDPRGWSATHTYFALIPFEKPTDGEWFKADTKTRLAFDHAEILEAAVERLRNKVEYTSLPAFVLPREFTLSELQRAYETVLGRALEKSAFRKRVLSGNLLEPISGKSREGPNRPAQLYRLGNPKKPVFFARTFEPR